MRRSLVLVAACAALAVASAAPVDPFAFFRPGVALSADERGRLARGESLARTLAASDREIAIFGGVRVTVDGDRLVAWVREIAALKKSPLVLQIGRFSDPPRLEDMAGLTLDAADVEAIGECRPGDCGLKIDAGEIARLQKALAGRDGSDPAVQDEFRRLVLARVRGYLADGLTGPLQAPFDAVVAHTPFLTGRVPAFADYLIRYPRAKLPHVESFLYWSKERFGGKPVIKVTHVAILRGADDGGPDALVAGKQIFATHYIDASLDLTAIVGGGPDGRRYLAFYNRSNVDVLGGFFGGLVRMIAQGRVRDEAAQLLQGLRKRIDAGPPPDSGPKMGLGLR